MRKKLIALLFFLVPVQMFGASILLNPKDNTEVGTATPTLTWQSTGAAGHTVRAYDSNTGVLPANTQAPVITLNGDNPLSLTQGETFTDPGATATDDRDGNVAVSVTGSVDSTEAGSYTLTYSATDNAGNASAVTRTVTVVAPATDYGIEVSPVSGNTASYNAIAEFSVSLKSQPTGDVVIPVSSSDTTEGVTNVSSLTFTTDNWDRSQKVVVKGRNPEVENGEQDYRIILGAADSIDQNYHGIDPDDVAMTGIRLSISSPREEMLKLIAGRRARIPLRARYSGYENLSFSLVTAPAGMTIKHWSHSADLIWPEAKAPANGEVVPVVVEVTDGSRTVQLELAITVTTGTLLQTRIEDRKVIITDDRTNLKGVSFEFIDEGQPEAFKIYKMDPALVPEVDGAYPPGTDLFYIDVGTEGSTGLRLAAPEITELELFGPELKMEVPVSIFGPGILNRTHSFYVMAWSDGPVFDRKRGYWRINNSLYSYRYDSEGNQIFDASRNLKGLYYISVREREVPLSFNKIADKILVADLGASGESGSQGAVGEGSISCTPVRNADNELQYAQQTCSTTGIDIKFFVDGFGREPSSTRSGCRKTQAFQNRRRGESLKLFW